MRWTESISSARVTACVLALGLMAAGPVVHAQVTRVGNQAASATEPGNALPYREVAPLKKDARVVRVFFMFDCPYCFQYDASFWQWGKSLPRNWKLEFTPIFTGQPANYIWIRAFYAVQRAAPANLERFMQLTYIAAQQQKRNLLEQDTWRDIVQDAGINRAAFDTAWASLENSEKLVGPIVDSTDHYRVEATPSVAIGGRYVITPDNTHGNPELFMQLLNAMISRAEGRA